MNSHLLKITMPVHLLCIVALFTINYTWLYIAGITFLWMLFGGYGIAVGYHKYFSHKSFETYPIIEKLLSIFGLMSMAGSTLFWVSFHRGTHHRYADQIQDLHSPRHGIFKSFIWWQNSIDYDSVNILAGRDILRNKFLVWQHKNQNKIFWGIIILTALISWHFALGVLIPACMISHHQDNFINVLGHMRKTGYRNFDTKDDSVNNYLTGWLFWGQGWHNNHHAFPAKENYGIRWWEFDSAHKILIPLIRRR
jgi:fatty-acid desaturase